MARLGRYKVMREMKDEDKWFRWFTKEQIIYLVLFGGIGVGIVILFHSIRLTLIGMVIAILLITGGLILPRFNMPDDKYILGGGMPLKLLAKRIIIKQFIAKKKIYVSLCDCNCNFDLLQHPNNG